MGTFQTMFQCRPKIYTTVLQYSHRPRLRLGRTILHTCISLLQFILILQCTHVMYSNSTHMRGPSPRPPSVAAETSAGPSPCPVASSASSDLAHDHIRLSPLLNTCAQHVATSRRYHTCVCVAHYCLELLLRQAGRLLQQVAWGGVAPNDATREPRAFC